LKSLSPKEIGVEILIANHDAHLSKETIVHKQELKIEKTEGSKVWYAGETTPTQPGVFDIGIRFFPKNDLLAHRQELNIVKWI
jgi:hypothetical protein